MDVNTPVKVTQTAQPIPSAPYPVYSAPYQTYPAPNQAAQMPNQGAFAPPPPYGNYGMMPPQTFPSPVAHGNGAVKVIGYSYEPPNSSAPLVRTTHFNTNSAMPSQPGYSFQPLNPTQELNMKTHSANKVWQEAPGYSYEPHNQHQTAHHFANNYSNQSTSPTWVEASGHTVPNGAFAGGVDKGGITLYVGRSKHRGSLTPGLLSMARSHFSLITFYSS